MGRRDEQPAVEFPEGDVATEKEKLKAPERNELDVRRFVKRLRLTPILIGAAFVSFIAFCVGLCVAKAGSDMAAAEFDRRVGFLFWPVPAHFSCFLLNLKSFHLQTAPLKRKFMALNLYSSLCAVVSYWLMAEAAHFRLVNYDAWGHVFIYFRPIQWIHTTPAMLHQLLMLGDQSSFQMVRLHSMNIVMLILGCISHVVPNKAAASAMLVLCWLVFAYEMFLVHRIFILVIEGAASLHYVDVREEPGRQRSQIQVEEMARDVEKGFSSFEQGKLMEVRMLKHLHFFTMLLWFCFGVVDVLHTVDAVPLVVIEHLWGVLDVGAKVLFSSSLTMTGVVSLYEAEKQEAWLAEQRAAAIAEAATVANREALMSAAIVSETATEQAGRIDELSRLVQEGWALVVGDMMGAGQIPDGYAGEPMKVPSTLVHASKTNSYPESSTGAEDENTMREQFVARASSTLRSMGLSTDPAAIRQRSRALSDGYNAGGTGTGLFPTAMSGQKPHKSLSSSGRVTGGGPFAAHSVTSLRPPAEDPLEGKASFNSTHEDMAPVAEATPGGAAAGA